MSTYLTLIHDSFFFFFNDTATTEIYTLSLHDALPISWPDPRPPDRPRGSCRARSAARASSADNRRPRSARARGDRKSTRLNSSHGYISYAVFCLKKKKKPEALLPTAAPVLALSFACSA